MKNYTKMTWFMTFYIELLIGSKRLRIRFDKIDGFIRINDGNRYLTLFGSEKYGSIYNRTRYLVSLKSSIPNIFFSLLSSKSLPKEKILTLDNVIILIKLVINKDKNQYYYNILLEKCSYQLVRKWWQNLFS